MPDIGAEARKAIDTIRRNYGGHVYLDDGRCAGWFDIDPTKSGGFTLSVKANPGSICAIAQAINAGNSTNVPVTLTDSFPNKIGTTDTWQSLAYAKYPFTVRATSVAKPISWATRIGNAFRNAFSTSPVVPKNVSFSPGRTRL